MQREDTTTTPPRTIVSSAGSVPEAPGRGSARAWATRLLVVGIVLAALNLRPAITSLGALLEEVRDGLGMSGTVAGLLTSVPPLCFAVFGVMAPRLARRFGPAAVVCAGMAAITAGLLIRPFTGSTAGFLAASALTLMGIAVSNVLMPVIVKRWFPDRVGSMTGLYSMALAFGTSIAAAVTVPLADTLGGWQPGLAVWAAVAATAVLPWLPFVRKSGAPGETGPGGSAAPGPRGTAPTGADRTTRASAHGSAETGPGVSAGGDPRSSEATGLSASAEADPRGAADTGSGPAVEWGPRRLAEIGPRGSADMGPRRSGGTGPTGAASESFPRGSAGQPARNEDPAPLRITRSRTAWALAVFFGLQATAAYITMGWMAQIFRDAGVSADTAGLLLAVTMVMGVPLAFVIPRLATRLPHQGPIVLVLGLCGLAGYAGLYLAPAGGAWAWAVLLGIANCAFPLALTMVGMRARTGAGVAQLSAFAQSTGYLISIPGPLLVGVLYQHSGGWGVPIALMAALMIPQILVGLLAGRNRTVEEEAAAR
ncbi:MFS transporter [Streptomyces sp. NPDC048290]|uniref:CynX/NimT family MFS transporter n=1 Tax=Streptomyces sp. NPDC048290 TaxID=3155811 RepID=UPI00342DBFFC